MPFKKKNYPRKHFDKDHVFSPVSLDNLQLCSLGIKPVNIILPLARAVVSIQVLFHCDFDLFHLLNDEWVQSQLLKPWACVRLLSRKFCRLHDKYWCAVPGEESKNMHWSKEGENKNKNRRKTGTSLIVTTFIFRSFENSVMFANQMISRNIKHAYQDKVGASSFKNPSIVSHPPRKLFEEIPRATDVTWES